MARFKPLADYLPKPPTAGALEVKKAGAEARLAAAEANLDDVRLKVVCGTASPADEDKAQQAVEALKREVARYGGAASVARRNETAARLKAEEAQRDAQDARTNAAAEAVAKRSVSVQAKLSELSEEYRLLSQASDAFANERAANPRVRSDLMTTSVERLVADELARIHVHGSAFVPGTNRSAWSMRHSTLRPLQDHFSDLAAMVAGSLAQAKAARDSLSDVLA